MRIHARSSKKLAVTLFAILSLIGGLSCGSDDSDDDKTTTPTDTADTGDDDSQDAATFTQVFAIMQASCGLAGCHISGNASAHWNVESTAAATYDEVSEYINTSSPSSSALITYGKDGSNSHPGGAVLTDAQAETFTSWMAGGGEND